MDIDFGALTRINNNQQQLRGLKEAAASDKSANEQAAQEFLETNRQTLIDLSQATINAEQPDAATIEWMNKLIRLAETLTTQFGNNFVNKLEDCTDNGSIGTIHKHDGGSMTLSIHDRLRQTPENPLTDFFSFGVDRDGDRLSISLVSKHPQTDGTFSVRHSVVAYKPGQPITVQDTELFSRDIPKTTSPTT